MAINVSTLPEYIQENRDELFVKAIASTKTLDYIESMLGVKGKAALNYLNSTVVLAGTHRATTLSHRRLLRLNLLQ